MKAVTAQSASYAKISNLLSSCSSSTSIIPPSFLQCNNKTSTQNYQSANKALGFKGLNLQCLRIIKPLLFPEKKKVVGVVHAFENDTSSAAVAQGWLLEPVGDGDCKHIGYKVALPGAYEIFSSEMVVGRAPEKADLVIPVATVSGAHARVQNKEGSLLVTDLDSTNGTYINEKRVAPGAFEVVPPGSLLTFGDTNLAIFRVSKIEKTLDNDEAEKSQEKETAEMATTQTETTS